MRRYKSQDTNLDGASVQYERVESLDSCRVFTVSFVDTSSLVTRPCCLRRILFSFTAGAVCVWAEGDLFWTVAVLILAASSLFMDILGVQSESVIIIPSVGLVCVTHRALNVLRSSTFVSLTELQHVFINEVITKHRCVFYLTLAMRQANDKPDDAVSHLLPLFMHTAPRLKLLQTVLNDIESCLTVRPSHLKVDGIG